MLLSGACKYGIRAAIFLATQDRAGFVSIREVSHELGVPFHFLTKVVHQLNEAGLVESLRGSRGGVRLTRPPGKITLKNIVSAIDGDGLFTECVLGLPGCGDDVPCPLHADWAEQRCELDRLLGASSLADAVEPVIAGVIRISS